MVTVSVALSLVNVQRATSMANDVEHTSHDGSHGFAFTLSRLSSSHSWQRLDPTGHSRNTTGYPSRWAHSR